MITKRKSSCIKIYTIRGRALNFLTLDGVCEHIKCSGPGDYAVNIDCCGDSSMKEFE